MELEKVFPELCTFGRYQRLIYMLVLLPIQLCYYVHIYSHIFLAHHYDHWCHLQPLLVPPVEVSHETWNISLANTTSVNSFFSIANLIDNVQLQKYFLLPPVHEHKVSTLAEYTSSLSSCRRYNMSYTQLVDWHRIHFYRLFANQNNDSLKSMLSLPTVACSTWTFNRTLLGVDHTIVTRWNLVCHHEWMQYLVLTVFFAGFFSGAPLCYVLCHNIGHRRTYLLMLLLYCSTGALQALVSDFKHFCLLRFLLGMSIPTIQIVTTDLMVELSGVRVLAWVLVFNELLHYIGLLMLTLISHFLLDYRHLSLALSLPFIIFVFLWWSFPESPNYLLISSRIDQLEKQILQMAHTNLCFITSDLEESLRRRIYIELAIYKEFLISSLMRDSFKKLDEYMHDNYVHWNVANTSLDISGPDSLSQNDPTLKSKCPIHEQPDPSLVEKFSTHLDEKYYFDGQMIHEIWSESESDGETMATTNQANGKLKTIKMMNGTSNSSSTPSTPPTTSFSFAKQSSDVCRKQNSGSIGNILGMPNMRRKVMALVYLLLTHNALVVFFNFYVIDFINADHARNLGHISAHSWFTFSVTINIISLPLASLCIQSLGRKFTFFLCNLLATTCALFGALFSSSVTSADQSMPFTSALGVRASLNLPLVIYSLTKLCQSMCYLTLLIWTWELLPPVAKCGRILNACFSLSNLSLLAIPWIMFSMKRGAHLSVSIPEELFGLKASTTRLNFPLHSLLTLAMLSTSTLVCLLLPETGTIQRLPSSLQEAEAFVASCITKNPQTTNRFYSLAALFNFKPPNIWPNGILKKTTTTTLSTYSRQQLRDSILPMDSPQPTKLKDVPIKLDESRSTMEHSIMQHSYPSPDKKEENPIRSKENFYSTLPSKAKHNDVSYIHLALASGALTFAPHCNQPPSSSSLPMGPATLAALDLVHMSGISPESWGTPFANATMAMVDVETMAGDAPYLVDHTLSTSLPTAINEIQHSHDNHKDLSFCDSQGIMSVLDNV